jgi:hypothetical protein
MTGTFAVVSASAVYHPVTPTFEMVRTVDDAQFFVVQSMSLTDLLLYLGMD